MAKLAIWGKKPPTKQTNKTLCSYYMNLNDLVGISKGLVAARIQVEYAYSRLMCFENIWCINNAVCF